MKTNSSTPYKRHFIIRDGVRMPMIGMTEFVGIANRYARVPAKVDTGADSSSIWASNITITKDNALEFTLFAPDSPLYDGHVFHFNSGDYTVNVLRNSTGDLHYRYQVFLNISIANRTIRAAFSLADRSKNGCPILIGRRTISGKFLVDVTFNPTGRKRKYKEAADRLTKELEQDPKAFQEKYHIGNVTD